jgi:CHAT domain-containing protein
VLKQQKDRISLTVLSEGKATKAALLEAFPKTDVLHYCGHAFFDGPGEGDSGLILAGDNALTLADLRGVTTPRVAFVNACEAGRVRGKFTTEAASFAEFFLRSGVEAYLGTFWTVNDAAAQLFAVEVYTRLATGKTLDEAVILARKKLFDDKYPDWANYILYGDGRFRLVREGS